MLNHLNPFRTTLKYDVNPIKRTITLTPTWGTILRAFAPSFLMVAILGVMTAVGTVLNEKDDETSTPEDPDEK